MFGLKITYCLVVAIVINWTKLRHWGVEIWSNFRPNFDPPSVETSTKLRPNFDQTSTKLRPNFDTPSVEVWSKVARYINEIHSKFNKMSTKLRHQTSTKLRQLGCRSLVETSTKLRHWGVEIWVEISTKLRHPIVQNRLCFG